MRGGFGGTPPPDTLKRPSPHARLYEGALAPEYSLGVREAKLNRRRPAALKL